MKKRITIYIFLVIGVITLLFSVLGYSGSLAFSSNYITEKWFESNSPDSKYTLYTNTTINDCFGNNDFNPDVDIYLCNNQTKTKKFYLRVHLIDVNTNSPDCYEVRWNEDGVSLTFLDGREIPFEYNVGYSNFNETATGDEYE